MAAWSQNDPKEILYGLSCPNAYNAGLVVFAGRDQHLYFRY
jgi:hypothetical protein